MSTEINQKLWKNRNEIMRVTKKYQDDIKRINEEAKQNREQLINKRKLASQLINVENFLIFNPKEILSKTDIWG